MKAEILNKQFTSVYTKEDTSNLPDLGPFSYPKLPDIIIYCEGVLKLLRDLKPHKASGSDNIPTRLLKDYACALAPCLTLIFKASLTQGKIPADWKFGHVTPIFKKGDRHKASNYRPITLTSVTCKSMEDILHSSIISHLEDHHILPDAQYGFRKKWSCETQLIRTIHDLAMGLNEKQQIDAILFGFSKVFDVVSHKRLLLKLSHYGICGNTLAWIQDFLSNRTQRVLLEGQVSSQSSVTSGVPQGSFLGPLLFLVFINDLPEYVSSTTRLFADDSLLYRTITSLDDARLLQEDLNNLNGKSCGAYPSILTNVKYCVSPTSGPPYNPIMCFMATHLP